MTSARLTVLFFAFGAFLSPGGQTAQAQLFHHGQTQTTKIVTRNSGHPSHHGSYAPATQYILVPAGTVTHQNVVHMAGVQSSGLMMTGQSFPVVQGTNLQVSTTPINPVAGTMQLGTGSGTEESDRQILSLGFRVHPALGDRSSLVGKLEDLLMKRAASLLPQIGNGITENDVESILFDVARSFLRTNTFGILIDDAFEPILKRFIDRIIAKQKQANVPDGDTTPPGNSSNGSSTIPAAGGTFTASGVVNGRITLTPTSDAVAPIPSDSTSGDTKKPTTAPKNDGGIAAPVPTRLPAR